MTTDDPAHLFRLIRPCIHCPFRRGQSYLHPERVKEITDGIIDDRPFFCHETLDYDGEDKPSHDHGSYCAGASLYQMHVGVWGLAMRFGIVFKLFDPATLDITTPVYHSQEEMLEAHGGGLCT